MREFLESHAWVTEQVRVALRPTAIKTYRNDHVQYLCDLIVSLSEGALACDLSLGFWCKEVSSWVCLHKASASEMYLTGGRRFATALERLIYHFSVVHTGQVVEGVLHRQSCCVRQTSSSFQHRQSHIHTYSRVRTRFMSHISSVAICCSRAR